MNSTRFKKWHFISSTASFLISVQRFANPMKSSARRLLGGRWDASSRASATFVLHLCSRKKAYRRKGPPPSRSFLILFLSCKIIKVPPGSLRLRGDSSWHLDGISSSLLQPDKPSHHPHLLRRRPPPRVWCSGDARREKDDVETLRGEEGVGLGVNVQYRIKTSWRRPPPATDASLATLRGFALRSSPSRHPTRRPTPLPGGSQKQTHRKITAN